MTRDWSFVDHVERALELAEDDEVRYHLRNALQHPAAVRGELDEVDVQEVDDV